MLREITLDPTYRCAMIRFPGFGINLRRERRFERSVRIVLAEKVGVADEAFDRLLDAWFGNIARVLLPGRALYCWGGYANVANYPPFLEKHGLYFSRAIIWDKQHPVLARKDFMGSASPARLLFSNELVRRQYR